MEKYYARSLELVKQGMIWRVGDGHNLNIWTDPWLRCDWSRRPITPRGSNIITEVSDLINPITGDWDQQLVNDIFWKKIKSLYWRCH